MWKVETLDDNHEDMNVTMSPVQADYRWLTFSCTHPIWGAGN